MTKGFQLLILINIFFQDVTRKRQFYNKILFTHNSEMAQNVYRFHQFRGVIIVKELYKYLADLAV